MTSIGASKLSLSSISTEALWKQSGRYSANSELLRLNDRRKSGFLLSPTHEEEITSLVADLVKSYKDLPLRLYQIGRKYRDERRPRKGLLRAKEFLMKDLYTFDYSQERALETYDAVRGAYKNLFDELKVPYIVAEADSGNMGGKLSHEYHYPSPEGEDMVWSCKSCGYTANEELVEKRVNHENHKGDELVFEAISADLTTKIRIHVPVVKPAATYSNPSQNDFVNIHAIRQAGVDIHSGLEPQTLPSLLAKTISTVDIYDQSLPQCSASSLPHIDLTVTKPGDYCPRCTEGRLDSQPAIEVGHTFHLGTRYSDPLTALVATPENVERVPMQMGCHGIGVSRLIGAIASRLHDERGLNWPRIISPFEVIIITTPQVREDDNAKVYDMLGNNGVDVVLDDRPDKSIGWKLKDADLIGYPVILVLGKSWKEKKEVEIQCRRLGLKGLVGSNLKEKVLQLLDQL